MKILLTNDDGIDAEGLSALEKAIPGRLLCWRPLQITFPGAAIASRRVQPFQWNSAGIAAERPMDLQQIVFA